MLKTLPISEVKARLPELVTGVEDREEEIVVTRKGKPAAVLVNYADYERLKDTLDSGRRSRHRSLTLSATSIPTSSTASSRPFVLFARIRAAAIPCKRTWRDTGRTAFDGSASSTALIEPAGPSE